MDALTVSSEPGPGAARVIGLVGGICSGKSTVAEILGDSFQAAIINADKLGHEAYLPGTDCCAQLISRFGERIVDPGTGHIDRKVLGGIVFGDQEQLRALEAIVWPEIGRLIEIHIKNLKEKGEQLIVLEAAVLLQAGWNKMVSEVWYIRVDQDTALDRLMKRNGFARDEALCRISKQVRDESVALRLAQRVIENSEMSKSALEAVVRDMLTH